MIAYGGAVEEGHVVMARFADGTLAVKRVDHAATISAGTPGWFLVSDNPEQGIDSRHRGPVPAESVLGVVRARLWPRPRRFTSARGL